MNIFFLHQCAQICAQFHFDKHVVKMILEAVQLLCSAYWVLEPQLAKEYNKNGIIYKLTHQNHPCSIWVRESLSNFNWLIELATELSKEHQYRFEPKAEHKSMKVVRFLQNNPPPSLKDKGFTPIALAMPENCKVFINGVPDGIASYRKYYQSSTKSHLTVWKKRGPPDWFQLPPDPIIKKQIKPAPIPKKRKKQLLENPIVSRERLPKLRKCTLMGK